LELENLLQFIVNTQQQVLGEWAALFDSISNACRVEGDAIAFVIQRRLFRGPIAMQVSAFRFSSQARATMRMLAHEISHLQRPRM